MHLENDSERIEQNCDLDRYPRFAAYMPRGIARGGLPRPHNSLYL